DNGGNVGIANLAPAVRLDIGSTASNVNEVIRVTSNNGFAGLDLRGDQGNVSGEPGGAYVSMSQDGGGVRGVIGMVNTAGQDGSGGALTGALANSMVVANKYNAPLHLAANNTIVATVHS